MHATARLDPSPPDRSVVQVRVPGHAALSVLDGRAPRFTPEQVETALLDLEQASGPIVELVRAQVESSWELIRADLNRVAGGEASPRVMVIAQHAQMAHEALILQRFASGKAFGAGDELAEKHMRNAAGLAVVATDALNKAYEAAREEAKARQGGAVGGLLTRIGASSAPSPPLAPGGGVERGPLPSNPGTPNPPPTEETK